MWDCSKRGKKVKCPWIPFYPKPLYLDDKPGTEYHICTNCHAHNTVNLLPWKFAAGRIIREFIKKQGKKPFRKESVKV